MRDRFGHQLAPHKDLVDAETGTLWTNTNMLKHHIEEVRAKNTQLEVENRALRKQNATLITQARTLRDTLNPAPEGERMVPRYPNDRMINQGREQGAEAKHPSDVIAEGRAAHERHIQATQAPSRGE
jgi:regulator of replication initiation timing